jgi:hypothetical protein
MLRKIGLGVSILLGLALGLLLAYFSLRWTLGNGLKTALAEADQKVSLVGDRLQALADLSLQANKALARLGERGGQDVFEQAQVLRSRLLGAASPQERLGLALALEARLAKVEALLEKASAKPAGRADYELSDIGRRWIGHERWLSKEEADAKAAVGTYNNLVAKWPTRWMAQGYTLSHIAWSTSKAIKDQGLVKTRTWGHWAAWKVEALWAKLRKKEAPAEPAPVPEAVPPADPQPVYTSLPEPLFTESAPWPEEFSNELQYRANAPNRADVAIGEEKAYLQRDEKMPDFKKKVMADRQLADPKRAAAAE